MKLSDDLINSENQRKKRKRESISSENVDHVDIKSPLKKNKPTAHQDNSVFVPDECHSKNTSVDNLYCDKSKNDNSLRSTYNVNKIGTELIGTSSNRNAESSDVVAIQCETNIETSPKKKKKKKANEILQEVDLVTSSNAASLSTKSLSNFNKDVNRSIVGSSNDVFQSEQSSPKKNEEKTRKSVEFHQEVDTISSNPSSNCNEENFNKPIIDSSNIDSQSAPSSPRKEREQRKRKKIDNDNSNESESISIVNDPTTNTSSNFIVNVTESTSELVESTEGILPRKKRKRKLGIVDENTHEFVSSSDSTSAPDTTEPNLLSNTNKSSETVETISPKKARNKRIKVDKNVNLSSEPVLPNSPKNIASTSDVSSKPLKSCLKKKKRKIKKKKNVKRQSNESSFKEEKKASNRSVSFDDNLKIEMIENCLVKVEVQNARKKDKALAYLKRWKEKQNWKFEKLTQSWLIKNMLREDMIPAEEFDCLLEYMVDLKGAARTLVDNLCENVISNVGEKVPEEEEKELYTAYIRARAVLQRLS